MILGENESGGMQLVDREQLRALAGQASATPRKRSHLLMHTGPEDTVQRLIIAAQPGTYVRPHRHSSQWEMLVLHRGSMDVLIFDDAGAVQSRVTLEPAAPILHIAKSTWHCCIVHREGTVVIEVKPGPYCSNEFASWAPEEGHAEADNFVLWASRAEAGQRWQDR